MLSKDLQVRLQQRAACGKSDVEVKHLQNLSLLLSQLILRVGIISDCDEVLQLGRVDFLVLAGDQHCSHTHELQLAQADIAHHHYAIENIYGDKQRLRLEVERVAHGLEPVNQDSAVAGQRFCLVCKPQIEVHEVLKLALLPAHKVMDVRHQVFCLVEQANPFVLSVLIINLLHKMIPAAVFSLVLQNDCFAGTSTCFGCWLIPRLQGKSFDCHFLLLLFCLLPCLCRRILGQLSLLGCLLICFSWRNAIWR